jgi:hypothetical protein
LPKGNKNSEKEKLGVVHTSLNCIPAKINITMKQICFLEPDCNIVHGVGKIMASRKQDYRDR